MSYVSGVGRQLNGSGADRVRRINLTEFRGTLWETLNDWFFGYAFVDYDWSDPADSTKFAQWTFSADQNMVATPSVDPTTHHATIEGTSGDADGLSNLRELHTIPETANWGVAHAQCEIYGGPKFLTGGTLDEGRLVIKPQHGIGLRAQEDYRRRTIIAWHDIAIGLPQTINLGVWSGNPDGSGFLNRQINLAMDLDESYTPTACSQSCDDDAGLVFDGTGTSTWHQSDNAAFDISGDWSAIIDMSPNDWTPVLFNSIFSKFLSTGNQRSYRARLTNLGEIEVVVSADGTATKSLKTDAAGTAVLSALAGGTRRSICIDFDADNGSGQTACSFYVSAGGPSGPWTQLGATVTAAGTTSIFNGSSVMEIGAVNDGAADRFAGRIHELELRPARIDFDGNQATAPVIDVRAQQIADGATSFVDATGRTWTRTGTATVENTATPTGTATIGSHTLRVGDRVNVIVGDELSITALQRTNGQDCQCTLPGGHSITTGSLVRLLFCSDSSFDGTFAVTVSGNTMTWIDAGSNTSGHTGLLWDNTFDRQTAEITAVGATTIDYATFGQTNASIPIAGNSRVIREFPYYLELKVEGTVAAVRAWGRHQSLPSWYDQDRALMCDLSKPNRAWTVTNRERTSNVATLTIGTHDLMIGDRIGITSVPDSSFNASNRIVTDITDTTFSYANTGSDVASTSSTGTATAVGSGTAQNVIDNPCPVGTGRVAFVNAHLGTNDLCKCVYGPFFGDNDPNSQILAMPLDVTPGLDLAFSIPTPTAGQEGTGATVTPSTVAGSFVLPQSGESVGAGPAVLSSVVAEPQVGASVGAGLAVTALAFSLPATAESVAAGPTVVARQFTLPAAGESVGAGPSSIDRAFILPAAGINVGAAPTVIPLAFLIGQATPVTSGNATATPAVLPAAFLLPAAALNVSVGPSILARAFTLAQAGAAVTAGPAVVARALALPAAGITIAAQVNPVAVAVLSALLQPNVDVAAGAAVLAQAFAVHLPLVGSTPPDPYPVLVVFGETDSTVRFGDQGATVVFKEER